jgi:flagellar assembly factor FliW
MKINTSRFGAIEVPQEQLIAIPEGILGFPDDHQFFLLEHDSEGTPFKWLQSVNRPDLAFIVMDPLLLMDNYVVDVDDETAALFGAAKIDDQFALMSIVNVPRENPIAMTLNVRAPIAVHLERRLGRQIVLSNEDYPIRLRIFPDPA